MVLRKSIPLRKKRGKTVRWDISEEVLRYAEHLKNTPTRKNNINDSGNIEKANNEI